MESLEEDAGTATNASRRESAREKDLGQVEDVNATSSSHQDTFEARTSCQTPAMSEDNFDGDSVPSPSTQDVNTSTEAILDMIDEIVDGPGAPKRLPLLLDTDAKILPVQLQEHQNTEKETVDLSECSSKPEVEETVTCTSKEESIPCTSLSEPQSSCVDSVDQAAECKQNIESDLQIEPSTLPAPSSLIPSEDNTVSVVENQEASSSEKLSSSPLPNIPSSSVNKTEQTVSDSENGPCVRTVKCVTSSDSRDKVVVESAESTSSDISVSEEKTLSVEPVTRSPLRRRLVRPALSRPDSTVSSTVDSSISTDTVEQSSECVTKDVSSSSDAVTTVNDSVKSEEIRNISEISICKAETSTSPPKKIKLIRQKINTQTNHTPILRPEIQPANAESEQCQSTSSAEETTDQKDNSHEVNTSFNLREVHKKPIEDKTSKPTLSCNEIQNDVIEQESSSFASSSIEKVIVESQEDESDKQLGLPSVSVSPTDEKQFCALAASSASENVKEVSVLTVTSNKNEGKKEIIIPAITSEDENLEEISTPAKAPIENESAKGLSTPVVTSNESASEKYIGSVSATSIEDCSEKQLSILDVTSNENGTEHTQEPSTPVVTSNESDSEKQLSMQAASSNENDSEKQLITPAATSNETESKEELSTPPQCESQEDLSTPVIISHDNVKEIKSDKKLLTELHTPGLDVKESLLENSTDVGIVSSASPSINCTIEENKELLNTEEEKTVPKLTIKVSNTSLEASKLVVPKLTIKPLKAPNQQETKIVSGEIPIPSVTKLNIKPIPKPAEKINELHRKSSSSEISESEYSENDDSASTSDQASASEQGPSDVVPRVTIKLGKPGTETEGKFYTEPNIPKLTIKGLQNSNEEGRESPSKLKVIICQSEDEKIPKLTIKSVGKAEGQPLSPKLTIKPIKPPDNLSRENALQMSDPPPIPKLKITTEPSNSDQNTSHVPKITIKPIAKPDNDIVNKSPKKVLSENLENIPVVTKLNIKPIIKPENSIDVSNKIDDKVPVVSKINIKPIVNPNDVDYSKEDIPKVTKINIKPVKSPDGDSSKETDCDDIETDEIPIVTKINIKPIIKPCDDDILKESENHSSETGTSSDENNDNIPVVTKINIKPICKPREKEELGQAQKEENIPVITKLNIKPLIKPDYQLPLSPKKERTHSPELRNQNIPIVTKLNIKPIVKPEENKQNNDDDSSVKNPPLLMRINRKTRTDSGSSDMQYHINKGDSEHFNNINDSIPTISKLNIKPIINPDAESSEALTTDTKNKDAPNDTDSHHLEEKNRQLVDSCRNEHESMTNSENVDTAKLKEDACTIPNKNKEDLNEDNSCKVSNLSVEKSLRKTRENENVPFNDTNLERSKTVDESQAVGNVKGKATYSKTNCTLLKKLLETRKNDDGSNNEDSKMKVANCTSSTPKEIGHSSINNISPHESNKGLEIKHKRDTSPNTETIKEIISGPNLLKNCSMQDLCKEMNENIKKPLEINTSDKTTQSSGQDSPRIILKINKTDHGASAKIITEDMLESKNAMSDSLLNKRRPMANSRRKHEAESPNLVVGKRLRSSKIVQTPEKSPFTKRGIGKRPSNTDVPTSPPSPKGSELSILDTKRLKLGQLLSNKSLTITPVSKAGQISPPSTNSLDLKQAKIINHSLLNNENCSKNGSSKLHNILSNLQAKQIKVMPLNDLHHSDRKQSTSPELKTGTSLDSNPNIRVEISPVDQNCSEIRETIYENVESRDFNMTPDPISQDPLEVESFKQSSPEYSCADKNVPTIVEMTPQPKKRGRPRKLPVSEGAKPITLPTPALEERPQRSLRLSRDRPVILAKTRGRGRGRGRRVEPETTPAPEPEHVTDTANKFFSSESKTEEIDPTSSRIKLPRLTEALDKLPSTCLTPLTSRRRNSSTSDMPFYDGETPDLKVVLDTALPRMEDPFAKSPEVIAEFRGRGRGGRGSRGGRGRASPRTPRGRGRGRGGGRGAMYMKETMGIYGRVCGPATTTVQLFEEETCMMDDNATPAKPSHLLDEDSQSSVKSSTNESSKMKKSKFADLFDSNKVWSASDVKEYTWPPPEQADVDHQVMMIQEQVAMFLSVKSFKRRYPELKRRTISGAERDYVLSKGLVSEALCDLGITAVDASEVLDIMLSDYPHKYEEYRSYQRVKQLTEPTPETEESKPELKDRIEMKPEGKPLDGKPELPKIDPEKTRQDMAAAAIASACEWNTRMNALRRPACVDLQSLTVQRRRGPPPPAPPPRVRPPHGFYPHALLPGQYQHTYRVYPPHYLRYFPLNTALAAPAAPPSPAPSSCESEPDWGSSSEDSDDGHRHTKRKKLTKVKRSSDADAPAGGSEEAEPDTCRACKLRIEANRKTTHERFLVCANCNAKLHPACVELSADTIRKCREYAWQCPECKTCCACARPADDDKMLFCDLCDRGFHIYCVGLDRVPDGRWHCVECAVCKSCGARSAAGLGGPSGPGQGSVTGPGSPHWHHQTRRGPGGHKLYSHSLCEPCARAYRIGRYCPLCERSFIGPKGTMQLVICKLCDRQLHQDCVRPTVSRLDVLDYTCGECRRGGITSRAAAVRLAPRTIATLFMAKRRFNKYAHRQYMAKCGRAPADAAEPGAAAPAPDAADASDASDAADASDPLDGVGD